jgi:hypothetical protein
MQRLTIAELLLIAEAILDIDAKRLYHAADRGGRRPHRLNQGRAGLAC